MRNTCCDGLRRAWDRAGFDDAINRVGCLANQNGKRVFELSQGGFQSRKLRLRFEKLRLGLGGIEFTRLAGLIAHLGDAQAFFLQRDVFVCDSDLPLNRADIHIGGRDIANQRHERIVVGGDG